MPPDLFTRLATDLAFRAAVLAAPARALATLALSPQQQRLLWLAARRLQTGTQPPRCAYWWTSDQPPTDARG